MVDWRGEFASQVELSERWRKVIHWLVTGKPHVQVKKRVGEVVEWVAKRGSKQSKMGEEGWEVVQRVIEAGWYFIVGRVKLRMSGLIEKCSKRERSERRREAIDWLVEVVVQKKGGDGGERGRCERLEVLRSKDEHFSSRVWDRGERVGSYSQWGYRVNMFSFWNPVRIH